KELGADVRVLKVPELAPQSVIDGNDAWKATVDQTSYIAEVTSADIEWADAIIFSTPTRFGVMASQMKQLLDTQGGLWPSGKTVKKVLSANTSAQHPHAGQEATIVTSDT